MQQAKSFQDLKTVHISEDSDSYLPQKRTKPDTILVNANPNSPTEQYLHVNVTSERTGCLMLCLMWNLHSQNYKGDLPHPLKQLIPTMLGPRLVNFIPDTAVSFPLCKNQELQRVSAACKSSQEGGTQAALCLKYGMDQKVTFKSLPSTFTVLNSQCISLCLSSIL